MTRPIVNGNYIAEAHKLFIKGAVRQATFSPDSLSESIVYLKQSIQIVEDQNGTYPRAKNELAYTMLLLARQLEPSPEKDNYISDAFSLSQEALSEDITNDYTCHWTIAFYYLNANPINYVEALKHYELARKNYLTNTDPMERSSWFLLEYAEALADAYLEGIGFGDNELSITDFEDEQVLRNPVVYNKHRFALENDNLSASELEAIQKEIMNKTDGLEFAEYLLEKIYPPEFFWSTAYIYQSGYYHNRSIDPTADVTKDYLKKAFDEIKKINLDANNTAHFSAFAKLTKVQILRAQGKDQEADELEAELLTEVNQKTASESRNDINLIAALYRNELTNISSIPDSRRGLVAELNTELINGISKNMNTVSNRVSNSIDINSISNEKVIF